MLAPWVLKTQQRLLGINKLLARKLGEQNATYVLQAAAGLGGATHD
jgi:hypothetical protein